MEIPADLKERLKTQQYRFSGVHSAVKICEWAKRSLKDQDFCYKQKFYGIQSHLCCQMTPAVNYCPHSCVFCWRPIEHNLGTEFETVDEPIQIIENSILCQRKLLTGFGGNDKINKEKLREAQDPMMFAISLSGEPTLYKKLPELIAGLKERKKLSFLVTNGCYPDALRRLGDNLPTQLYITLPAPDKEVYIKTCRPALKDGWERIMESISLLKAMKTRTVLRLTLVDGLNMVSPEKYGQIIKESGADFAEVKGYVWVGFSRKRLGEECMPEHKDIMDFARKVADSSGYSLADEKPESRVALLVRDSSVERFIRPL